MRPPVTFVSVIQYETGPHGNSCSAAATPRSNCDVNPVSTRYVLTAKRATATRLSGPSHFLAAGPGSPARTSLAARSAPPALPLAARISPPVIVPRKPRSPPPPRPPPPRLRPSGNGGRGRRGRSRPRKPELGRLVCRAGKQRRGWVRRGRLRAGGPRGKRGRR